MSDDEGVKKTRKAKVETDADGPRRRGRRKKFEFDSINKLTDGKSGTNTDEIKFSLDDDINKDLKQTHVSFGNMNIILHTTEEPEPEDLRKLFDKNFKLGEKSKVPSVLIQGEGVSAASTVNAFSSFGNGFDIGYVDTTNTSKQSTINKPKLIKRKINAVLETHIGNTVDEWPKTSSIWCWWCSHPFNTSPIPCPIGYDDSRGRFIVKGVFCSWGCVASYSVENYKSLTNVYTFKKASGHTSSDIKLAPPKIALSVFGGILSIEEFRDISVSEDRNITVSTDHISYINQQILDESRR